MGTPTANYGFVKDDGSQNYDVAVVNANLDAIDAAIKARQDAIAALDAAYKAADVALDARLDVLETPVVPAVLGLPSFCKVLTGSVTITATAIGTAVPGGSTMVVNLPSKTLLRVTGRSWINVDMASGAGDVRAVVAWSGANTGNAQDVYGGALAFGMLMYESADAGDTNGKNADHESSFEAVFEAGSTTFSMQAYRAGAGSFATSALSYSLIQVTPLRLVA